LHEDTLDGGRIRLKFRDDVGETFEDDAQTRRPRMAIGADTTAGDITATTVDDLDYTESGRP
jgi:hypothetical protein